MSLSACSSFLSSVNAVYFTGYEFLKRNWTQVLNPPRAALAPHASGAMTTFAGDGTPVPVLHDTMESVALPSYAYPICGALSGCLAAAATAPLDLVKTRLQTQGKTGQYTGAIDCAVKIVKHEGASSMMRGLGGQSRQQQQHQQRRAPHSLLRDPLSCSLLLMFCTSLLCVCVCVGSLASLPSVPPSAQLAVCG